MQTNFLIAKSDGQTLKSWSLSTRFDSARAKAASIATGEGRDDLAERIREFQFLDIGSKAASETADLTAASRLLGHTDKQTTDKVYRRVGEHVEPTR